MNIETLKIPVHELQFGMQVVKLDRPWLETPFKLQGFCIRKQRELNALKELCTFVYIDIERGVSPPAGRGERVMLNEQHEVIGGAGGMQGFVKTGGREKRVSRSAEHTALPAPEVQYALESTFESELPHALVAVRDTKAAVKTFMQNLNSGKRGDLNPVRDAATALEASTLRNPDPVMLLRGLRSDEPFSYRHCVNSAILGIALSRELGFRRQQVHELTMGVLLADIGKLRLPKELLRTTRRLYPRETEIIQRHVPYGVEMARAMEGLTSGTIDIIAAHHERFNGSGYPAGLSGGEIPLLGRIAGLVDSFDAITSERTYSEAIPIYEAVQEMYASTIDVFQRDLVEKLIQVLGTYPVGSLVALSDGVVAVVVALNRQRRLLPKVIPLTDTNKAPVSAYRVVDLAAVAAASGVSVKEVIDPGQYGVKQPTAEGLIA